MSQFLTPDGALVGNEFSFIPPTFKSPKTQKLNITQISEEAVIEVHLHRSRHLFHQLDFANLGVKQLRLFSTLLITVALASLLIIWHQPLSRLITEQFARLNSKVNSLTTRTEVIPVKKVAVNPASYTASTDKVNTAIESIVSQPLRINIGDNVINPNSATILSWLNVSTNTDGNETLTLKDDLLAGYLNQLVTQYNRPVVDQVTVSHSDGTSAMIIKGVDGLSLGSISPIQDTITNQLFKGGGLNLTIPTKITPFQAVTAPEQGKLLEADVTHKKLYAWQNGQIVNTFLSSDGAAATPTPIGTFHIYAKFAVQDMHGPNADGSTYSQPNVPWINYFSGGNAVHGNYWRPASWFGRINSSHGCVGLMVNDAKWVYNWAPIGTTVVTHL